MEKKVVFITGAAKGIGAKTAEEFSKKGYNIIVHYNSSYQLAVKLKSDLETKYFNKVYLIKGDLNNNSDINKIVHEVKLITKHLDALVNNAALSLDNYFLDKTSQEFADVLSVNLIAPFILIKSLIDILDGGVIINVSSTDAIDTGSIYNVDYSASKAGLITLTKILGSELKNINIYAIVPNWVKTESVLEMDSEFLKNELNRINQKELILPEVVAKKIVVITEEKNLKNGTIIRMDDNNE